MRNTRRKKQTIQGKRASYTKKYNPTAKIVKNLNKQVKARRRGQAIKFKK